MKLPHVRFTVRRMMVLVLVAALLIRLGDAAVDVHSAKETHVHIGIDMRRTPLIRVMGDIRAPFWPRYWRHLLGRPWRSQPVCPATPGFVEEECEFAHPEMVIKIGDWKVHHHNPRQAARLDQILAEQNRYNGWGPWIIP